MPTTRLHLAAAAASLALLLALTACGEDAPTVPQPQDLSSDPGSDADTGAGDFQDADHKVHFLNLYSQDGTPYDVDVYWGTFQTGDTDHDAELATTIPYGEVSDYLAARTKGFFSGGEDTPPYWQITVTETGTTDVIGHLEGGSSIRQQMLFTFLPGETLGGEPTFGWNNTRLEVASESSATPPFPEPVAGKTHIVVQVAGSGGEFDGPLPAIKSGDTCLTHQGLRLEGDKIPETDGSVASQVITVDAGATVELVESEIGLDGYDQVYSCGASLGATATLPDAYAAWVLYGKDHADQPTMWVVPVDEPSEESNAHSE